LKPENVLLSKDGIIKICDFGSSKVIDPNGKNTPYIVSRYYRAPELILCLTKYTTAIDIWAVGCIMAELFLLTPLFKGKTEGDQLFAIFKVLGSLSEEEKIDYQQRVPFEPSLLNSFGVFKRINLKEYFKFIKDKNNFVDLLLKMLAYLP
jgi:glycogen synthase kinase 3 beta